MQDVEGKVAFITGGASGMGLGMASVLARRGMKVVIADLMKEALDEAMADFGRTNQPVHAIRLGVADREAYARAADEGERVFGEIHVLVNNAGVGLGGPMQNATFKDWDFNMSVNVGGVINGLVIVPPRILAHGEDEPPNVKRAETLKFLAALLYNPIYDEQKPVKPPEGLGLQ